MAGRIPDETLHAIRDRVSLVEVVSSYVSLKRAGRNHLGLCPFHSEKTPSFTVNEERGLFHCFGCGAGGTVFTFLMRIERLEFPEAVEQLAKRAGVTLPERERDGAASTLRERLYELNQRAARFFQQVLQSPAGADARRYLAQRGLAAEIIGRYGVGFAPPTGTALAAALASQRDARDLALQLGLLGRRQDGGVYDRFRGRVMFPIRDRRERVVGFGGRTLGGDEPKYLNSPESPVFRKGDGLYGLVEAREAIRAADRVVVVEGYMDVLLLAQNGIPYTVAVLGTALTAAQLLALRPFGGEDLTVFFFFDGDQAGRKAAKRACAEAFKACVDAGMWGKGAFLPEGFDPDSYVRQHGGPATLALLDGGRPLADFYLDCVAPPAGAPLSQRARAAEEVKEILSAAKSQVQFELLAQQAAVRLGVSDELFRRRHAGAQPSVQPATSPPARQWPVSELLLVETMAADPDVALWVAERGTLALFEDVELMQAGQRLIDRWQEGGDPAHAIEVLSPALASRLTAALLGTDSIGEGNARRIAEDCAARIHARAERRTRQAIAAELRQAEGRGDEQGSLEKLTSLNQLLRRAGGVT